MKTERRRRAQRKGENEAKEIKREKKQRSRRKDREEGERSSTFPTCISSSCFLTFSLQFSSPVSVSITCSISYFSVVPLSASFSLWFPRSSLHRLFKFFHLSSKHLQLQEPAGDFLFVGRSGREGLRKHSLSLLWSISV